MKCAAGVMVSIEASQALDPGSIPGRRTFFKNVFWFHFWVSEYFRFVFGLILIDSCLFGLEKWGRRKVIKKLNQFGFNKDKKAKRKKKKNAKCQKKK